MDNWRATTASGTVYIMDDDGFVRIYEDDPEMPSAEFRVQELFVTIETESAQEGGFVGWKPATEPQVGNRMYLSGLDSWRKSTTVVSVE